MKATVASPESGFWIERVRRGRATRMGRARPLKLNIPFRTEALNRGTSTNVVPPEIDAIT